MAVDSYCSKRKDSRLRRDRISAREHEWKQQRGDLIRGYLAWRAGETIEVQAGNPSWSLTAVDFFGPSIPRSVCPL